MFEGVDIDPDRLVGDLVAFLDILGRRLAGRLLRNISGGLGRSRSLRDRCGRGRSDLGCGLAEGALELVERDLARTQRPLQRLHHQRAFSHCRLHRRRLDDGHFFFSNRLARRHRGHATLDHGFQLIDQVAVVAVGLGFGGFEAGQNLLDAVDRGQDQRHGFGSHRHAVTEFAHQGLAGMRQRLEPRQPEEAASALDGVHQAENVIQDLRVVRVLLELHQLVVDRIQALAALRQELAQQIVHETNLRKTPKTLRRATSTRQTELRPASPQSV